MNRVFEDFLSVALREALGRFGGEVRLQGAGHLDRDRRVDIVPDSAGSGRADDGGRRRQAQAPGGEWPAERDVYQMLAYCTSLGLRVGYLVYASDPKVVSGDLRIRNSECEVRVRTVDLAREPDQVLSSVADLAAEIAREPFAA